MTTILAVADDLIEAGRLRVILEGAGYGVVEAPSGERALELLRNGTEAGLLISNIALPAMSGYQLCTQVKHDPELRHIPVILLTSFSDSMDIIHGLESGADSFIIQPCETDNLLERVGRILENCRLRAAGELKQGAEIRFLGRTFNISSDNDQVLDLLLSTFEDIVRTNRRLEQGRSELDLARSRLQEYTVALEGKVTLSEERYGILFDAAPDAILVLDVAGIIQAANHRTRELFGYEPEELIGSSLELLVPRREKNVRFWTPADEPGATAPERVEVLGLRKDGELRSIELTANDVPSEAGYERMMILRDITERKAHEEHVRRSETRLRQFLETMPYGVIVLNGQGEIYFTNSVGRTLGGGVARGHTLTALRDKVPLFRAGSDEPYPLEERPLTIALAGKTARRDDIDLELEGRRRRIEMSAAPIFDRDGAVEYVVAAYSDITERVRLSAQLRQAQKLDALGMLAGGVAHDFNNILMAISTFATIISRSDSDPPIRKHAEEIRKAAGRGSSLTRQLLTFAGQQQGTPRVLNINQIITSTSEMLRRLITSRISFEVALDPNIGDVIADEGQIQQILMNLVLNARDAIAGEGRVTIETKEREIEEAFTKAHVDLRPARYVILSVSDTGHGIDQETMTHLFEPFFTTKPPGLGTGLGLPTVHGIVRECGGAVIVESEVGRGSTFSVYFPRTGAANRSGATGSNKALP